MEGLNLSRLFAFEEAFYTEAAPSLELGRSFVVPEHQKKHHALNLLWRGIGGFVQVNPQYENLYGTVSLSRIFDPRSVAVMCSGLIQPIPEVRAHNPMDINLGPEWEDYLAKHGPLKMKTLSTLVEAIEGGRQSVPVLLRHYHKLGADFLAVTVDQNFNDTPGLLLRVNIPSVPKRMRDRFVPGLH